MKRLLLAACLAVGIHVALFSMRPHWTPPALLMPQSRNVTISLVEGPQAPPQKVTSKPVVQPKPKPIPKPKPVKVPRPIVKALPEPEPTPSSDVETAEPEQQQVLEDPLPEEAQTSQATGFKDGAVIQNSVPRYDINPRPSYPPVAKRRGYEGTVVLDVLVTREGRAGEVIVVQSSGYAILDRRALATVKKWVFVPARRGTEPVEMQVTVPIVFELN